jgi:hypothetical protein
MPHYEKGRYKATVTAQGFSESKEKKTPYLFLEVAPFEALGASVLPEKIYRREIKRYVTEKTINRLIEDLRGIGWNGTKLSELDPSNPSHHSFIDQEIEVDCDHDGEFDRFDLAYEPSTQAESMPGIASKLDKLYGKALVAAAPAKKATPKPAAAAVPEGVPADDGDDEIPF